MLSMFPNNTKIILILIIQIDTRFGIILFGGKNVPTFVNKTVRKTNLQCNAIYYEDQVHYIFGNNVGDVYDEHQRNLYYDMVTNVFYETVISDNSREELNMQNSFIIHCKKNHLRNMQGRALQIVIGILLDIHRSIQYIKQKSIQKPKEFQEDSEGILLYFFNLRENLK